MAVRVTLDRRAVERLSGRLGSALLLRRAERVAQLASRYAAGHGTIPEGIIVVPVNAKTVKVVSTNPHSLLVHNGSPAHPIFPRQRGKLLRFEVGGRVVFARRVNHPGYKGDPFLTRALRAARS